MPDHLPDLPANLREFWAAEVVSCDRNSLALYMEEGEVLLPAQLVNHSFASTPTALLMYQVDSNQLFGVWKITCTRVSNHEQVLSDEIFSSACLSLHGCISPEWRDY